MESEMVGIGQMSRESGLTVSALRFYDTAAVVVPAWVDPRSGYRWYGGDQITDARLVAALRRVGMPLNEIRRVLDHRCTNPQDSDRLLSLHLQRLEDGLADARIELSAARAFIHQRQEKPVTATDSTASKASVDCAELIEALRSIRFAVSADPNLPMLTGVYFDLEGDALTVVATDRYRLAHVRIPAQSHSGPAAHTIAPVDLIDSLIEHCPVTGDAVTIAMTDGHISLSSPRWEGQAQGLDDRFPDHRRLVRTAGGQGIRVNVDRFRAELGAADVHTMRREEDAVDYDMVTLSLGPDGVTVGTGASEESLVGVNREFLLQALDAGNSAELFLELDGPIAPLAMRHPEKSGAFSILMPTRLPQKRARPRI